MPAIRLYHARHACSLAVVVALNEAGLVYDLVEIDLSSDRADYRTINPSGRVPALAVDESILVEVPAILVRIADLAPDWSLLSPKSAERCEILSFLSWCSSHAQIARRCFRKPTHFTLDPAAQNALRREAMPRIEAYLYSLDERVRGQVWMAGDAFSVADCHALVLILWACIDAIPLTNFERLSAWTGRMLGRPAVRAALDRDGCAELLIAFATLGDAIVAGAPAPTIL